MSKSIRFRRQSQTDFYKQFSILCNTHTDWNVWSDFVFMSAAAISNALNSSGPTHDAREHQYLETIRRYSKEEQEIFPKLLSITVKALEDEPDQDFLGEVYTALGLSSHWKGQFFTPYNICHMMAEMMLDGIEERIEQQGWVCVNDPCCGAGALLVAARNAVVKRNISSTNVLFAAQDIDPTVALMCYIQLALLGCAGYVVIADSLRHPMTGTSLIPSHVPEQDVWYLPMFYHKTWQERILWYNIAEIFRCESDKRQEATLVNVNDTKHSSIQPGPPDHELSINQSGQLSLF